MKSGHSRSLKMTPYDWWYTTCCQSVCKCSALLCRFRVIRRWKISWPWNLW